MKRKQPPKKRLHDCDFPGCPEAGEYRAPKDRTLSSYYWFCQKHVAEYNKNWDFLKGLSPDEIERFCPLDNNSRKFLQNASVKYGLSPRGVASCIKLSRTIADLEGSSEITEEFVAEAVQYRKKSGGMDFLCE